MSGKALTIKVNPFDKGMVVVGPPATFGDVYVVIYIRIVD